MTTTTATPAGLLDQLADAGVLTPVDLGVAEAVCRLTDETRDDVRLAVALAARAPRHGHVCVELDRVAARTAPHLAGPDDEAAGAGPGVADVDAWPDPARWRAAVAASTAVRAPDDEPTTPLVLDGQRLYLDRYWHHEQGLEDRLRTMAADGRDDTDPAAVRDWLDRLFPADGTGEVDRQRLAGALATARSLTVLSGGPGTGKTTTIVRIMTLLLATAGRGDHGGHLRIALAAPTGKAAARLQAAIRETIPQLPVDDDLRHLLEGVTARTVHRLLGWRGDNATRFRHHAGEPLPYDVVIVDEASMVSLALMARLVDAVPATGRLLLVGDRNQLVSVEAGAVLGDLCGPVGHTGGRTLRLSDQVAADLQARTGDDLSAEADVVAEPGIWDSLVQLERFHRFGPETGIGSVARAIQRIDTDTDEVVAFLRGERTEADGQAAYTDVALVADAGPALPGHVREAIVAGYRPFVEAVLGDADPVDVLAALDQFRVLAALRHGPRGVHLLNDAIEGWLAAEVEGFSPRGAWYVGRPVLVTQNDYGVELFNGDVGVVVRDPADRDQRTVAFPTVGGGVRVVGPARLPPHETVFAMTVHKSQGSQFGRVAVVLPAHDSPVLTRELVYTGVTRASQHMTVVADEGLLRAALLRPVQRASGLADRLWPQPR